MRQGFNTQRLETVQDDVQDTASIDLAIAFFCAVLVLFVFVAFNLDRDPESPPLQTLSQTEITSPVFVASYSPINTRTSFLLMTATGLFHLDLPQIGRGLRDSSSQYNADDGYMLYTRGTGPSPAEFLLTLNISVEDPPADWVAAEIDVSGECLSSLNLLLTVFHVEEALDPSPLLAWAEGCGQRVRFEPITISPDGRIGILTVALNPGAYAADRIFR
ncbi:MAG: hypothetical protein AAGL89_07320 [Pseudomonadota bacterium]